MARIVLLVSGGRRKLYYQMGERYGDLAHVILGRQYGQRRRQVLPVFA